MTVIELLSRATSGLGPTGSSTWPSAAVLASPAHLVEIDLFEAGRRCPRWGGAAGMRFSITISRPRPAPGRVLAWARTPARDPDPAPPGGPGRPTRPEGGPGPGLDEGGIAVLLYDGAPDPPLETEDAAWASSSSPGWRDPKSGRHRRAPALYPRPGGVPASSEACPGRSLTDATCSTPRKLASIIRCRRRRTCPRRC